MKHEVNNRNVFSALAGGFLALAVLVIGGCTPEMDPLLDLADSQIGVQQVDDLERTMNLASSDNSYDFKQYEEKVSGGLNRWIRKTIEDGAADTEDDRIWAIDPMIQQLKLDYDQIPGVAFMDKLEFVSTDPYFVRERRWMKQISDRVCDATLAPIELTRLQASGEITSGDATASMAELYRSIYPEMSETASVKLAEAILLFDWVTRNVQLEEPIEIPEDNVEEYTLREGDNTDYAARGVPGLGYRRFIWQVLIYGRADYVERAKLFSGLLRQREIDSAMLIVGDQPWVVSVFVDGKAWLFDTRLGLPIPGEKPGQIATLAEVKSNADLLKRLDLTVEETNRDDSKYWVKADDLAQLRAELFTSPETVSRRMSFLQRRLLGDQRLVLVDEPTKVAAVVTAAIPGIKVSVSRSAYQTLEFRKLVGEARKRASFDEVIANKLIWYYSEEAYIDDFVDYRSARNLFFIGRFEVPRNSRKLSAAEGFYSLMYPDEIITDIGLNGPLLNRLGIYQETGQSPAEFQRKLASVQQNMRLVRRDTGLFLAQSLYDNGNAPSAASWLVRLKDRDDVERWIPGMNYLEARAMEVVGDYDSAMGILRKSEGAQFVGNMLRARMLAQAIKDAGLTRVSLVDEGNAGEAVKSPEGDESVESKTDDAAEAKKEVETKEGDGGG